MVGMSRAVLVPLDYHAVSIAALVVRGETVPLRAEVEAAVAAGVSPVELREAVLVASLFSGFPRALTAFLTLNEVLGEVPEEADAEGAGRAGSRERGEALFRQIHGPNAPPQIATLATLPAAFTHGIYVEAYGRILAREGLSLKLREMVAVSCLVALDLPRTLRAHLLASLRLGASSTELTEVVERAGEIVARDVEPLVAMVRLAARSPSIKK